MNDLASTLKERGGNYGPAIEHFNTTREMFRVWKNRRKLSPHKLSLEMDNMLHHVVYMVCDKLARASHNPCHLDDWKDIQGYTKLLEQELESEQADPPHGG